MSFGYFDRLSYVYQILQNAEAAAPFVEGNQINYPQIFRGVTVRYTCGANRLKEEIVFSQAAREALPDPAQLGLAADHTYLVFAAEFNLSPNNLNALAHRAGGRDPIRTGNGFAFEGESRIDFEDERENLYFFFPHDYAWAVNDSVSEPAKVRRVFYSQQGKNHLLIGVPWRWVRAAAPGPLLIDPTIYNDYANDTRLQSATNVGSETTLMVGKKSGQVKKRTIIKFDLQYSSIPSNATVLKAQMQLYYFNATVAGGSAWVDRWVQAHELLKPWHELQADSSERLEDIPWLAPRAKIGPGNNPITVDANGQFESTLLFQQGEHPTWKSWDLTNLTQKWVNTPSSNNGVILWATNEDVNSYDLRFYSSENETKQPELMIIWSDQPKTVYFLKDHLGSIRATVLDSAGAPVVGYSDYDPWGYILAKRDTAHAVLPAATRNKFTGKEWDDDYGVNWLFFPARSYDPEIARWMVRDPLAMKYPSWSPYNYVLNNPVRLFDPDGKQVDVHEVRFFRDQALRSEGVDLAPFHQADAKVDLVGSGVLAGGLAAGALAGVSPYLSALFLANATQINRAGIAAAEALAPGAENLSTGAAGKIVGEGVDAVRALNKADDVVIGHFPEYLEVANELGAKGFSVPGKIWSKMSEAEKWAANKTFLDRAIKKGAKFILATPMTDIKRGNWLKREIDYLLEMGYQLSDDGTTLTKGN